MRDVRRAAGVGGCLAILLTGTLPGGALAQSTTTTYTYDKLGRLISAASTDNSSVTYAYDPAGNRTQVNGVSSDPTANTDIISTSQNAPVGFDPRTNDTDPTHVGLTVVSATQGAHGGVVVNGSSPLVYTPVTGYAGADSFTYQVVNYRGASSTGTVNITVSGTGPSANADSVSTAEDTAVTFDPRANDGVPAGNTISISALGGASHGSAVNNGGASVSYTPATGYAGPDSFTYTITDNHGLTSTATVSVTVTNVGPTAHNDSISTAENTGVTFDPRANDNAAAGNSISISAVGSAGHGSVVNNGGASITYTPTGGYVGADNFTYTIADNHGGTSSATVAVTVNDTLPTAVADSGSVGVGQSTTISVLANDSAASGNTISIAGVTQGAHGSVTNNGSSVTYTASTSFSGTDSFTYTIADNHGGTATATVTMTVTAAPLTASLGDWNWNQFNQGAISSDPPVACTTGGGVGPYTYTWTRVAGDTAIFASPRAPSNSTSIFSGRENSGFGFWQANFQCTVTDSLGHTATSNSNTVTFEHDNDN